MKILQNQIMSELKKITRDDILPLLKWLEDSDFFIAPCSSKYHLNIEGGLAQHSWNVFYLLTEKNDRYKLGLNKDTIRICGLLHDVCKIDFYKKKMIYHPSNIITNQTPISHEEWEISDKFSLGHGEKSVIVLQRFIKLTDEECCMIRWHMGKYGDDFNEYHKDAYYNAIKMYPSVLALFTADYEATTFLENVSNKNLVNQNVK